MDRDVTIRFYELQIIEGAGSPLENIIREIDALDKTAREKDVSGNITLRLEHLREQQGLLFGDLTRVQTENLPGHVTERENDPLPVTRIGHPAAFCYDPETQCMALQFDIKIGVGRVCDYFGQFVDGQRFGHLPVLRQDALDRFEDETPTKMTVKIARVRNFANLDLPLTDFEDRIESVAALFEAPSVEITVSCRGVDGGLDKASVMSTVRRWLGYRDEIDGINKVSGSTVESDEAFNFIKFLLKEKDTLDLPANDPIDGREKRFRFVRQKYGQHRSYLRDLTGVS